MSGRGRARAQRRLLLAAGLALLGARASAARQVAPDAGARLRAILERTRAQNGAQATPPEQRVALLAAGERALAEGNADAASALFEQAGFIKHAADAELGLIRSYMQQGEYRRALAFAAHTAGAHPDVAAGSALYAWLLNLGGQSKIAGVILDRARSRLGSDPTLDEAQALLASPHPRPAAALLAPPARFAPLSPSSIVLPATARAVDSGVLARSGRIALTAASVAAGADRMLVRNGLGHISAARLTQIDARHGIAVLELVEPIVGPTPGPAARDPFPGSPGYLVECAPGAAVEPAWPSLRIGFLGRASTAEGVYALGIEAPAGPRGGPVFGGAGQWVGLSVSRGGDDAIVLASQLHALVAEERPAARGDQAATQLAADEIYERALAVAVEVIAAT